MYREEVTVTLLKAPPTTYYVPLFSASSQVMGNCLVLLLAPIALAKRLKISMLATLLVRIGPQNYSLLVNLRMDFVSLHHHTTRTD